MNEATKTFSYINNGKKTDKAIEINNLVGGICTQITRGFPHHIPSSGGGVGNKSFS